MYDLKYTKDVASLMNDFVDDLSKGSVYNDDFLNEEVYQIRQLLHKVESKLEARKAIASNLPF